MRSRKKCPTCKSCTWWLPYHGRKYTICYLCKEVYKLLPGNKLERINVDEEFTETPVHILWKMP